MRQKIINIAMAVVVLVAVAVPFVQAAPAMAASDGGYTAILGDCESAEDDKGGGIFCILNIILNVLTTGVGVLGTLGIVISGIQYLTARDNPEQLTKAKSRLINIVIGLAIYAVMYGFLQWIIPGGILNGKSS